MTAGTTTPSPSAETLPGEPGLVIQGLESDAQELAKRGVRELLSTHEFEPGWH